MGRKGWYRRCRCCNGPRTRGQLRATERRQWRREVAG